MFPKTIECDLILLIFLSKICLIISKDFLPEILITAIALVPPPVAIAQIVSE
jgi:hypothetical protein